MKWILNKRVIAVLVMAFYLLFSHYEPVYALDDNIIYTDTIETEWKYKIIKGKLYKRLWSKTRKKWLTKWIRVK